MGCGCGRSESSVAVKDRTAPPQESKQDKQRKLTQTPQNPQDSSVIEVPKQAARPEVEAL